MQTFQYSKTLRKKPGRFSTDTSTHHNHLPSHLSRAVCAGSPCDRAVRVLCKAAVTGVCWGQISFPWSCQALSAVITMICHDTAPGKVQVCLLQDQIFAVGQCRWTITYHVYKCHGDRLTLHFYLIAETFQVHSKNLLVCLWSLFSTSMTSTLKLCQLA